MFVDCHNLSFDLFYETHVKFMKDNNKQCTVDSIRKKNTLVSKYSSTSNVVMLRNDKQAVLKIVFIL